MINMQFASDPPISQKIHKMKERVCWKNSLIKKRNIDQTRLVIDDGHEQEEEFSFLVIGDSGTGYHTSHSPQRKVAELLLQHRQDCRFILHTGDVVYLVGSSEYYPANFILPYQEFLVGGEQAQHIKHDQMLFNLPFLPVLGNHDYYDLNPLFALAVQATWLPRRLLKSKLDIDVGWHGSYQGKAYSEAFLDYLKALSPRQLEQHLDQHYTAEINNSRCLRYQPEKFTRLPNRYYTFRYGGIDFFALDSNTFNAPNPIPRTQQGDNLRVQLQHRLDELEAEKQQLMRNLDEIEEKAGDDVERLDDYIAKIEQLEEQKIDVKKQLAAPEDITIDLEQLDWLKQQLIASWQNKEVRGRVIYFHHPPYVTEATKWNQGQTLVVRDNLRDVFNEVAKVVGQPTEDRPLVNLVLTGHAHCLEYIYTRNTGFADSYIHWIICGGSGYSLRRQRKEGQELMEFLKVENQLKSRCTAESLLFVGRTGQGRDKRRPYSALRIDVSAGQPLKLVVQPLVAERFQSRWVYPKMQPLVI